MTVDQTLAAVEIAKLMGVSKRAVLKRSVKEKWLFLERIELGGTKRWFPLSSLPEDIVKRHQRNAEKIYHESAMALVCQPGDQPGAVGTSENLPAALPGKAVFRPVTVVEPNHADCLPIEKINSAMIRAELLKKYEEYLVNSRIDGIRSATAKKQFIQLYHAGAWPELLASIGEISAVTLDRWRADVRKNGDNLRLADRRGLWKINTTILPEINQKIFLACVLHPNKLRISEAHRMASTIMQDRGIPDDYHPTTYRRWLDQWRDTHYHIWVFNREGVKAWNDKCAMYLERDITLIQVGDIAVADGHILNFDIINPFTGKPKRMMLILWVDMRSNFPLGWEILPTENTMGIASAFRRACVTLGKFPKVAYLDNGRAFSAKFFEGQDCSAVTSLFERSGIATIHAWPYHGQSKVIERFFGTFAELERWMPSYTGTSIENKPPRLMRGEKVHRALHGKITGGNVMTLDQAHIVIAAWFDEYAQRPQSGHLEGACPLDVFDPGRGPGLDPLELNLMMMAEHIASPGRNGVYFMGKNYYHPDLANIRLPVVIRYDLQKRDSVLVYMADTGEFIGEAVDMGKVHPAASILGTESDKTKLIEMIKIKKHQEKEASRHARSLLESDVLPEHQRRMNEILLDAPSLPAPEAAPGRKRKLNSDKIMADAQAQIEENRAWNEAHPDPEEEIFECEVISPAVELRHKLEGMSEIDRYETLLDMEVAGQMVPIEWRAFMTYFEMTPMFKRFAQDFEIKRKLAAEARHNAGKL